MDVFRLAAVETNWHWLHASASIFRLEGTEMKTCRVCKNEFEPVKPMQRVCGYACALSLAASDRAKAEKVASVKERKATKEALGRLKTRSDWMAEAQVAFNSFVRARDAGKPCICCGKPMGENIPGGAVDAGHYRSRGSAPHLRFDERNCHAQRKQCNRFDSGNVVGYRLGLIERIGLEAVEALECDQVPANYDIEDLKFIKSFYASKARELRKAQE